MTNILKPTRFPSGLIDENVEIFTHNEMPMALQAGEVKSIYESPEVVRLLSDDLNENPAAVLALELGGFHSPQAKLEKYTNCRYGGFDNSPDVINGQLAAAEYHECGFRGSCAMEGIVCSSPRINGRVLSPFETEMVKQLATEDIIPVMAEKMAVSVTTFEERKKLLFEKFNVLTRTGLVAEAFRNNILGYGVPA